MGDAQRTAYEASEDGVRILCLGACYTVGLGTAPEQSYPAQLERRLDRLAEGDVGGATVYNGGVRGKSIDHFALQIEPLLAEYQPDIIVVGVNHRTSLDPSPPAQFSLFQRLLLPRMISLALAPPAAPVRAPIDPVAQEIASLEAQLEAHPDRPPLRKKLAELYSRRGDHARALEMLAGLVRGDRTPPPLAIRMFRHAAALGSSMPATAYLRPSAQTGALCARCRARRIRAMMPTWNGVAIRHCTGPSMRPVSPSFGRTG